MTTEAEAEFLARKAAKRKDRRGFVEEEAMQLERMTWVHALWIGVFQCLALVPGTSRSGATIAGAMVLGFRRTAAAEFSFLVGLPILYGATLLKLWKGHEELFRDSARVFEFSLATVTAFVSAALVVGPFVRYLQRHTFVPFAWYRIAAGGVILLMVVSGYLPRG